MIYRIWEHSFHQSMKLECFRFFPLCFIGVSVCCEFSRPPILIKAGGISWCDSLAEESRSFRTPAPRQRIGKERLTRSSLDGIMTELGRRDPRPVMRESRELLFVFPNDTQAADKTVGTGYQSWRPHETLEMRVVRLSNDCSGFLRFVPHYHQKSSIV